MDFSELPEVPGPDAVYDILPDAEPKTVVGKVEWSFYLSADYPNELAETPDDLIGRSVRQNGSYFRVVSREGEHFVVEPVAL